MKYQPHTTLRDLATLGCFSITPRKVSAAKRAIARQRNRDPLFADPRNVTDGEAIARVKSYQDEHRRQLAESRKRAASAWLQLRRVRRRVPAAVRVEWDQKWAEGMVPHRPEYGLDLMRAILCGYYGVGAYKLTDCTLVQDGKVVG